MSLELIANELLTACFDRLESDPSLLKRAQALLSQSGSSIQDGQLRLLTIKEYADRSNLSISTVRSLIRKGLPTLGAGPGRRIDAWLADSFIRKHKSKSTELEIQANRHAEMLYRRGETNS